MILMGGMYDWYRRRICFNNSGPPHKPVLLPAVGEEICAYWRDSMAGTEGD